MLPVQQQQQSMTQRVLDELGGGSVSMPYDVKWSPSDDRRPVSAIAVCVCCMSAALIAFCLWSISDDRDPSTSKPLRSVSLSSHDCAAVDGMVDWRLCVVKPWRPTARPVRLTLAPLQIRVRTDRPSMSATVSENGWRREPSGIEKPCTNNWLAGCRWRPLGACVTIYSAIRCGICDRSL